jgi:hypothetical protein
MGQTDHLERCEAYACGNEAHPGGLRQQLDVAALRGPQRVDTKRGTDSY